MGDEPGELPENIGGSSRDRRIRRRVTKRLTSEIASEVVSRMATTQSRAPVPSPDPNKPQESTKNSERRLSPKEVLLLIAGTALALGSLRADDPLVIIPMLMLAGLAFLILCVIHPGKWLFKSLVGLLIFVLLLFIGWRDLRKPETHENAGPGLSTNTVDEQRKLIKDVVQYAAKDRIVEISDELALNLRVQIQRQKYLSTNPSPFNYFQFGFQVIYRAREGNWGGDVITPGETLSGLGVHEQSNEVSFIVRSPKISDDAAQLKAFSENPLLPPPVKWDLDQYIQIWGKSEEAIADVLNDYAQKGHIFVSSDQDALTQELFRRITPLSEPYRKLANDARQELGGY